MTPPCPCGYPCCDESQTAPSPAHMEPTAEEVRVWKMEDDANDYFDEEFGVLPEPIYGDLD